MSEASASGSASAPTASESGNEGIQGIDIAAVMKSTGPTVKCVLLRHIRSTGRDAKPHPASPKAAEDHKREVLVELIDEIEIDTTPSKGEVKKVLGGPFTFLGQFPDEGLMVMVRRELPEDLSSESIGKLREFCADLGIETSGMIEKNELVSALQATTLPVNPHKLQPPLDDMTVRGDILLLKVAETDEVLDENKEAQPKDMSIMSNEEFFLNYTKDEWVAFASRTDVVAPKPPIEEAEEDDGSSSDSDDEDEAFEVEDVDEDIDEDDKNAMLNLIMGEVLKQFREDNERGPNTQELLEIRSEVAKKLGVEVAEFDEAADEETDAKKRAADPADPDSPSKKVKFTASDNKEEDDRKPPAEK